MLRYLMIAALLASVAVASRPAVAGETLVVKRSAYDVKTTIERLKSVVEKKGLKFFALFDHADAAKEVGLKLPPTEVLVFGSPKLGTLLMQNSPTFALDLPLKVLVWKDADGTTRMAYTPPATLAARHDATGVDKLVAKMTKVMDAVTSAAAQ